MEDLKSEVTILLERVAMGDDTAEKELLPRVYRELHRLALCRMQHERGSHTLQPTALVHEAYLRVCRAGNSQWKSRAHFFAVSARVMRNILTDYARHRQTQMHGAANNVECEHLLVGKPQSADLTLAIDGLLNRLAAIEPRQAKVIEMRFFAGLTEEEIADVLGVSSRTVKRDWLMARAWLHTQWKKE